MTAAPRRHPAHAPRVSPLDLSALAAAVRAIRPAPAVAAAGGYDRQADLPAGEVTRRHAVPRTRSRFRPAPGPQPSAAPEPVPEQEHAATWELVRRAQAGDGEAFGELYDAYVETVFRYIYFRVRDRNLAEDFTSETFLRALRRIGSISYQGRDIGAWFVTIARNIVFDHAKSARTRLETVAAEPPEPRVTEPSPEQAVLTALTNERLLAAVDELGDEQRECVTLRFIHGFSVAETAEIMGKKDGAIKAMQHRAVRKLADLIGDEI